MDKGFTEKRVYPSCCTSAFCGRVCCEGCDSKPVLDEFKAWVEATGAVQSDPIWCPSVWVGTKRVGK